MPWIKYFLLPIMWNRQTYAWTAETDIEVTFESKHPSETVMKTKMTRHSRPLQHRPGCVNDRLPPVNGKYF